MLTFEKSTSSKTHFCWLGVKQYFHLPLEQLLLAPRNRQDDGCPRVVAARAKVVVVRDSKCFPPSIHTKILPSTLNFTTNTGYMPPILRQLPLRSFYLPKHPWGTTIIHWHMPPLSTICLTLPLKLQQIAHVACSIKCIDLADRSMIKMYKGISIICNTAWRLD